jgi:pyruvate/2-oxoglutarate dehydrogenase complex dihydrolipoamide dehydrogenase (E3) component
VRSYDGFTPDLIVVGGGMGGISAAMRANALGARVLLAEPESLGGT